MTDDTPGMCTDHALHCRMYDKWVADQAGHLTKTKKRARRAKTRVGHRERTPPVHPCDETDVDEETLGRMADFVLDEERTQRDWVVVTDGEATQAPRPSVSWWQWLLMSS